MKLTRSQLLEELREQISALILLSEAYDNGNNFLFKDIAVRLRVLFHHSENGRSKSLLKQLNLDNLELYDSAKLLHEQVTNAIKAPIHFKFNNNMPFIFYPDLHPGLFKSNYNHWWEIGPIIIDKFQHIYTRQQLIKCVTDNAGGAHVDIELPPKYFELSKGNASGWSHQMPGKDEIFIDPVPAVTRQIAHEVIETFGELDLDNI